MNHRSTKKLVLSSLFSPPLCVVGRMERGKMKARGGGWEGKEGKRGFPWAFLLFCLPIVHCAPALFRLLLF